MALKWKNEWALANLRDLARYVKLENLPIGIPEEMLLEKDLRKRVESLYNHLLGLGWKYTWEVWNSDVVRQILRHPDEIANTDVATCVDLSLLFCGACVQARLVPWIVVFKGHVLVMVSTSYDVDTSISKNTSGRGGDRKLFDSDKSPTLGELLQRLTGEKPSFVAVECTGFSIANGSNSQAPGAARRPNGVLTFKDAAEVAVEILQSSLEKDDPKYWRTMDVVVERIQNGVSQETESGFESDRARALRINRELNLKLRNIPLAPRKHKDRNYELSGDLSICNENTPIQKLKCIDAWHDLNEHHLRLLFLIGPGGSGKSAIVERVVDSCDNGETAVLLFNLKNYVTARDRYSDYPDKPSGKPLLEWISSYLSVAPLGQTPLETVLQGKVLIVFDGLNEVPDARRQFHDLIKWILFYYSSLKVLVTSREPPPDLREWSGDPLAPFEGKIGIISISSDARGLAYYRDRGSDHSRLLTNHYRFTESQIAALGQIAFLLYREKGSTSFSGKDLKECIKLVGREDLFDNDIVNYLNRENRRIITPSAGGNGVFAFINQSLQDYLAAKHLSGSEDAEALWTVRNLDAVTVGKASFETLKWALHEMPSTRLADAFLNRVYDWNWRAAFECLSGPDGLAASSPAPKFPHSSFMKNSLVDLLKEKIEDPILKSRTDAVGIAQKRRETPSADDPAADRAKIWESIYRQHPGAGAADGELIGAIVDKDAIFGWAAANVLRRFHLDSKNPLPELAISVLVGILRASARNEDRDNAIRWRVVHALGVFPSAKSENVLIESLNSDPDDWVRFGAARALMEISVRTGDRQKRRALLNRLLEICLKKPTSKWMEVHHVGQAVLNCMADEHWSEDVREILQKLRDEDDERAKTKWDSVLKSLDDHESWRGARLIEQAKMQSGLFNDPPLRQYSDAMTGTSDNGGSGL